MKKTLIGLVILFLVVVLFSAMFYSKSSISKNNESVKTFDNVEEKSDSSDYKKQDEIDENLWRNRTIVKINDARMGDRFLITPLGISLDANTLPEETRYSVMNNSSQIDSVYFEYGDLDTSYNDRCFGSLNLITFDSKIDVEGERITFSVMDSLARTNGSGVKKIGDLKFVHFEKNNGVCNFSLNDKTGLFREIRDKFIKAVDTAEVL